VLGTIVLTLLGLLTGGIAGRRLAQRGVTADNALVGRQAAAYAVLLTLGGMFAALYFADRLPFLPDVLVLWGAAAVWPFVQIVAALALGLTVTLEWPGRREPRRLRTLLAAGAVLVLAVTYLGWRQLPLVNALGAARLVDGVVMQTTSYTCGPASIATLARASGMTDVDERRVVELAGTSRGGTTSLAEIRAMRRLGLEPEFARHLTPADLAADGRLAVLHVDEPVLTAKIRHAVALLAVDSTRRTITIGNPLYGRQVKSWDDLRGYWIGEAIFVGR